MLEERPSRPTPVRHFARTTVGTLLHAALLGLRDALHERPDDEVAVVRDHAGDPPGLDPVVLRLDPDEPADSLALVRPWLLGPVGRDAPARRPRAEGPPVPFVRSERHA